MGGKIPDQETTHVVLPTDQEGSGVFLLHSLMKNRKRRNHFK